MALSAPVVTEPLVALAPLQPPEAVHPVALVLLQLSVEDAPLVIEAGAAERVTVGAEVDGDTTTVADLLPAPPAPVQVRL